MKRKRVVIVNRGGGQIGLAIFVVVAIFASAVGVLAYVEFQKQRDVDRWRQENDRLMNEAQKQSDENMRKLQQTLNDASQKFR